MVVGVCDDDVVLRVDRHSRRLRELPLEHAELAELGWINKMFSTFREEAYKFGVISVKVIAYKSITLTV